jgi:hypothetical protein
MSVCIIAPSIADEVLDQIEFSKLIIDISSARRLPIPANHSAPYIMLQLTHTTTSAITDEAKPADDATLRWNNTVYLSRLCTSILYRSFDHHF